MTDLERLEQAHRLTPRTVYDAQHARELAAHDPAKLTDVDLATIGYFGSAHEEATARAARDAALGPQPAPADADADAPLPAATVRRIGKGVVAAIRIAFEQLQVAPRLAALEARAPSPPAADEALIARLARLDARLTAIEGALAHSRGVHWRGVYRAGDEYAEGDLVTRRGGLWLCTAPTGLMPGVESAHAYWKLIVKEGGA